MKCHFCKKREGEIPISDEDGNSLLICEKCDNDMFDAHTLQKKIIREINIQIRHHKARRNIPAINSLNHIKYVLLN